MDKEQLWLQNFLSYLSIEHQEYYLKFEKLFHFGGGEEFGVYISEDKNEIHNSKEEQNRMWEIINDYTAKNPYPNSKC